MVEPSPVEHASPPWMSPGDDARFERFTQRALRALALARSEAERRRHNFIGSEHLLLGLLVEGTGLATTLLVNLGLDVGQSRVTLEAHLDTLPAVAAGRSGLTPRAKQVIELAVQEARKLNHHYVGQEHLLLGLAAEEESIAARLLVERGITLEQLRAEVVRVLTLGVSGGAATAPKATVVTCRLTEEDVQALDDLVEAGVRSTRSDAAAWLIHIGIEANAQLLETVRGTVAEIRRLREQAQALARQVTAAAAPPPAGRPPA
jgi:ATP-dependent Clp protease ATP-binding subunit ClpA